MRLSIKNFMVPALLCGLLAGACAKNIDADPFIVGLDNGVVVTGVSNQLMYIVDEGLERTEINYEKYAYDDKTLAILDGGIVYRVDVNEGQLELTPQYKGTDVAVSRDKIYVLKKDGVYQVSNETVISQANGKMTGDDFDCWRDSFYISVNESDVTVWTVDPGMNTDLIEKSQLKDIKIALLAENYPEILYVPSDGNVVVKYNLYSGMTNVIADARSEIINIRYFEKNQLLTLLGEGWISIHQLDTGKIEMGNISAIDTYYDRDYNQLFLLTDTGILVYQDVTSIVESNSGESVKEYLF